MNEKVINFCIKGVSLTFLTLLFLFPFVLIYYSLPLFKVNNIFTILLGPWEPEHQIYGLRLFATGTLIMSFLATLIASLNAILISYIVFYFKNSLVSKYIRYILKGMAGIPTIVYSIGGLFFLVPIIAQYTPANTGLCILSTAIILSIVILPTISLFMIEGFRSVNKDEINAAISVGASKAQLFIYIVFPRAVKSVITAILLGLGRAVGDTMVALVLSGNALVFANDIFSSTRNLTSHIAMIMPGEFDGIQFKAVFFSALILLFIIFVLNLIVYKLEMQDA